MASVVSKMVRDSVTSYVQKDLELARQVMLEDDKVDRLFDNIREEMVNYIAINKGQRGSRIVDLIMVTKYLSVSEIMRPILQSGWNFPLQEYTETE